MPNPQDPRKSSNPGSVNEQIQDRVIRHLLFLTRLQSGEAKWMREQIQKMLPDLTGRISAVVDRMDQLRTGSTLNAKQIQALEAFSSRFTERMSRSVGQIQRRMMERIFEIARSEIEFEVRLMQKVTPIEIQLATPKANEIEDLVLAQPLDGRPLEEWFTSMTDSTRTRVLKEIREGMVSGESVDEIVRRIRGTRAANFKDGVLSTTTRHAESIVRSAVIHASSQATAEMYRKNKDIIKGAKWVSTLDARTCTQCMSLDGTFIDLDVGPWPPAHVSCRCTMTPILKSWEELDIDLEESEPGTRSSMDGQVPEDFVYNDWLQRQPNDVVVEALGRTRAKLYQDGGLSVTSFVDRRGRLFTLEELRERENDVFEELGI